MKAHDMNDIVKHRALLALRCIEMNKSVAREAAVRVCKPDLLAFVEAHNGK